MALGLALAPSSATAAPGDLDPSFSRDGLVRTSLGDYARVNALALQPDGKIVAVGANPYSPYYAGRRGDFALARYNPDGSLDSSFSGGKLTTDFGGDDLANDIVLQPGGKIVIAGGSRIADDPEGLALARHNPDGSLDPTFSQDGKLISDLAGNATAVALQPDGKIVATAPTGQPGEREFAVVRFNPDGSIDTSFSGDGKATTSELAEHYWFGAFPSDLALQPDGRIVVAGSAASSISIRGNPFSDVVLARYEADGDLDPSFAGDGTLTMSLGEGSDHASALALQPDGRIIAAGSTGVEFAALRFLTDGTLDPSFSGDGRATVGVGDDATGVALLPDGSIVLAGRGYGVFNRDFALARLNSSGVLDRSFAGDGTLATDFFTDGDAAFDVAVQPDGRIVAAGQAVQNRAEGFALARYLADAGEPDADADGVRDSEDRCPARYGEQSGGCPRHHRSLTIDYDKDQLLFHGELSSRFTACQHRNRVVIFKTRPGRDREVGAVQTRFGDYRLLDPARSGSYYAKTERLFTPEIGTCPAARSETITPRPNRLGRGAASRAPTIASQDGSLAAHFEFTVAITDDGPRILTPWHEG